MIARAAMQLDKENDYGYEVWEWSDDEFAAIDALCGGEDAVMRSADEWQALIDAAFEADDGTLAGRLEIAQRVLEL